MQTAETFTFTQKVTCADADGVAIREGSVLKEINDGERGVVTRIVRASDTVAPMAACIGDIVISISGNPSTKRVTNRYAQWRHIPHNDQTYSERFLSWMQKPFVHDEDSRISRDQQLAIDGILNLLPDDVVDWTFGLCPDRLQDALHYLVEHLTSQNSAS